MRSDQPMTLRARLGAVIATVGLVLGLVVAVNAPPAAAAACNPFPDVTSSNPHCGNIAWLKGKDITKPADGKYHPASKVSRGSMTAFLFRLTHPGEPSPKCTSRPFPDVSTSDVFCGYIKWAVQSGVTFGYPDGTFKPSNGVTRGAMAAFLQRISGKPAAKCTSKPFADVPVNSTFCKPIAWMMQNGITYGVGNGTNYGTTLIVNRQSMASFLHRIDDLMHGKVRPAANTALAVLATLAVKGKAPMTGYDREGKFGPAWTDNNDAPYGQNGCRTRDDILARDLTKVKTSDGCRVTSGVLVDPYTAKTIHFVYGVGTSNVVQIDHVVALGNAWQSGAQQISYTKRVNLANDPLNLLAVDGPTNAAKGKSNAAEWLPPNKSYRCAYVARQIAVKAKYKLWVTAPEKDAMDRVLAKCPAQKVPTEGQAPPPVNPGKPTPPSTPSKPKPPPTPKCEPGYDPCLPVVDDLDCADIYEMGLAPVRVTGSDRYRLDRDGDGWGCTAGR